MSKVVIDAEVYKNYFLLSAMEMGSKRVAHFELSQHHDLNRAALKNLMASRTTVSFNGLGFDLYIISCALQGWSNDRLKWLSDKIIKSKLPAWRIAKDLNLSVPKQWDHIDTFDVAPGRSSLKIYGGRMHQERLEDLPIDPDTVLTREQMDAIRSYCVNDLETTRSLYLELESAIDLRVTMSKEYGMDLRSKSDAQVAETIIQSELTKLTGKRYRKPDSLPDSFRYRDPEIIMYRGALNETFKKILSTDFHVGGNGAVVLPDWLKEPITISGRTYKMGIGGLHSQEVAQFVTADDDHELLELDVTSYYPSIILQQGLAPKSIGKPFLDVYRTLVKRRILAKRGAQLAQREIAELERKLALYPETE